MEQVSVLASYRLIDFGRGRKLESFGDYLVDRPCPAAESSAREQPFLWDTCDARFTMDGWQFEKEWPQALTLDCLNFQMPLEPKPFGHIGVFPEQMPNWLWLQQQVSAATKGTAASISSSNSFNALNLFAYTGASTLALARAGAAVAHVDAAKQNVQAARRAAMISGLDDAPIRYLVDDAYAFSQRESRRGRRYQCIVLDPPSYGHGPKGNTWRLERDIWELLRTLMLIADSSQTRWLITGHSPEVGPTELLHWFQRTPGLNISETELGPLELRSETRVLNAGWFLRLVTSGGK